MAKAVSRFRLKSRYRRPVLRSLVIISAILMLGTSWAVRHAEATQPENVVSSKTALKIALSRLEEEAAAFRESGDLPRDEADFAEGFEYTISPSDIERALLRVHGRDDAVVDAYIRWQLLSFGPDLEAMDTGDFEWLVNHLPAFIENPSADPSRHARFEMLAERAGRNADAQAMLQEEWESLNRLTHDIELLNQPALAFRDTLREIAPTNGARRPIFLLFDLQSRIEAGWDTRSIKTRITKELKSRKLDDTISLEKRWELIKYVEDLPGTSTKIVRDVSFYASAPADVHYSTLTVRSTDVTNWTAYLNRHDPR